MGICSATMSPSPTLADNNQQVTNTSGTSTVRSHGYESQKSLYDAGVQVKFLHLEAEVESLLQHLQALKKERTATEKMTAQS